MYKNRHPKTYFLTHEAASLSGFSKYMLDYLAREDIFAPLAKVDHGRGISRRYSYADVVLLRALHGLCTEHGKVRHLKMSLKRFRIEFGSMRPGDRIDRQIFVIGNELHSFTPRDGGRQLRTGQQTFSFVINLEKVTGEVADSVVVQPNLREFVLTDSAARDAEEVRQRFWTPVNRRRAMAAGGDR